MCFTILCCLKTCFLELLLLHNLILLFKKLDMFNLVASKLCSFALKIHSASSIWYLSNMFGCEPLSRKKLPPIYQLNIENTPNNTQIYVSKIFDIQGKYKTVRAWAGPFCVYHVYRGHIHIYMYLGIIWYFVFYVLGVFIKTCFP